MRKLIVIGLEKVCGVADRLPWWLSGPYACRLARLSHDLDQRWGTEVWK